MATQRKAVVLTAGEFARRKSAPRGPTLIQLTESEVTKLKRGGTRAKSLPKHICGGVQIMPLPGGRGYVGIPMCGPDEVPDIGPDGVIRCRKLPSAPSVPGIKPQPGRTIGSGKGKGPLLGNLPCGLLFKYLGLCIGRCDAGRRCKKYVLQLTHGTYVYCYCG